MKKSFFSKNLLAAFALLVCGAVYAGIDLVHYEIGAAPKGIMMTYWSGPLDRGFAWFTSTSVNESKVYLLEGEYGADDATMFVSEGELFTGTVKEVSSNENDPRLNCHQVKVDGLQYGRTYSYRLGGGSDWVYGTFTARDESNHFLAVNVNDAQTKKANLIGLWENSVAAAVNAADGVENIDLFISGGDLCDLHGFTDSGTTVYPNITVDRSHMYVKWCAVADAASVQLPGVAWGHYSGNHDYQLYADTVCNSNVNNGCWSYDSGNVHIASIPEFSEGDEITPALQTALAWLEQDLAAANASGRTCWNIVMTHWGPYSTGDHGDRTATRTLTELLGPICAAGKVDLFLQAHDHTFSKTLPYRWSGAGYTQNAADAAVINLNPAKTVIGGETFNLDPDGTYYICSGCAGHRVNENYDWANADGANSYRNFKYKRAIDTIKVTSAYATAGDDASNDIDAQRFGILEVDGNRLVYNFYVAGANGQPVLYDTLKIAKSNSFRVTPYVQHPATNAMSVLFFTEKAGNADVKYWKDGGSVTSVKTTGVAAETLDYGSWEKSNKASECKSVPFKHRVRIEGLETGTTYNYAVELEGVAYTNRFRTAPGPDSDIRFIYYNDSETEPESTGKKVGWENPVNGDLNRPYLIDQTTGYASNLVFMAERDPDFYCIAGDIAEMGGEQRDWDEFWRHNAGSYNDVAGSAPILAAPGNHDYCDGNNGSYTAGGNFAMNKYLTYFEFEPNDSACDEDQRQRFHRLDYGPVTLLFLDTNNGDDRYPDKDSNHRLYSSVENSVTYNRNGYTCTEGSRAPDFNEGSAQFIWLTNQLAQVQGKQKFVFVVNHQIPYSVGVHNRPNGDNSSNLDPNYQYYEDYSGRTVRFLVPYLMKYGVSGWLCGHDEIMEHSRVAGVEELPDGGTRPYMLDIFDMATAGDGLRGGVTTATPADPTGNSNEVYRAHKDAPEVYDANGILIDGGKHYGHMEINVRQVEPDLWTCTMEPVYSFVSTNAQGVASFSRRVYNDVTVLTNDLRQVHDDTLDQYVQPGLVLHFDAKSNQGAGKAYNPAATNWTELVDGAQSAVSLTGTYAIQWGDSVSPYMTPSNTVSYFGRMTFTPNAATLAAANSKTWTQQLCQKTRTYFNHDMEFFGFFSGQEWYLRTDYAMNMMMQYLGMNIGIDRQLSAWMRGCTDTLQRDNRRFIHTVDAKEPYWIENCFTDSQVGHVTGGGRIGSCKDGQDGDYELYAIRLYDRALARVEIAHNHNVDAQRYFGATVETNYVNSVSSTNVNYGTPVPAYLTPLAVADGSEYTFSIASTTTVYPVDSVRAAAVNGVTRAVYDGATVRKLSPSTGLATVATLDNATTSYTVTIDTDYDVVWNWRRQYGLFASSASSDGGSIQIESRPEAQSEEIWYDAVSQTEVTLRAVPKEGWKFLRWSGDVPAEQMESAEITLTMDEGRTVAANFVESTHEPVTLHWKNTNNANWSDAGSWVENAAPQVGDTVIIEPNGNYTVNLDLPTARLGLIVISNKHATATTTIKPTDWFCKLDADEIILGKGVLLTTAATFSDSEMSNRVWICANNFTMHPKATINMDNCGWKDKSSPWYGFSDRAGGGHGGRGGMGYSQGCNATWTGSRYPMSFGFRFTSEFPNYAKSGCAYDSLEAPELPGASSDKGANAGRGGGGAVRIDIANHAKIDGKIYARGYGSANGSYGAAGGGAVWISTRTVEGSAFIDVGQDALPNTSGGGGGGGRISVTYDTAAQATAGYVPTFEFRLGGPCGRPIAYARNTAGSNPYYPGEEGTLFLSDTSFFLRSSYAGGGRVYFGTNPTTLNFPNGLVITNSTVSFPQARTINVTGDLKVGGKGEFICEDTVLNVSGDVTIDSAFGYASAGAWNTQCCGLDLKGVSKLNTRNLTISNFGLLWTFTGPTNTTTGPFTVDVAVQGNFLMTANAYFIPQTHPTNALAGATRLTAKNVQIDSGAWIDGRGRGFQSIMGVSKAFGPGAAPSNGRGASHAAWGGMGYSGWSGTDGNSPWLGTCSGAPYGNPLEPLTAGSAGRAPSGNHIGSFGGGQIWIEVGRRMTMNGTVSVAAQDLNSGNNEAGCGSGGSIYIKTPALYGTGTFCADGGDQPAASLKHGWNVGGGGGGGAGYIAVYTTSQELDDTFTGTMSAEGGLGYTEGNLNDAGRYDKYDHRGFDGSIICKTIHAGTMLIMR